jgi:sugar lactone lactonase YvrE
MFRSALRSVAVAAAIIGLTPLAAAAGVPGGPNGPEPLVRFAPGSFPESMALSGDSELVTLGFAGELVRVTGNHLATVATVDLEGTSLLTGVVVRGGYAYVARAPFAGGPSYLYRLPVTASDASPQPWVTLSDDGGFPNGLAARDGRILVAEYAAGVIRAVSVDDGTVTTWCANDLLRPGHYGFGVNGITFGPDGAMYGVVSDFGRVLRLTKTAAGCTVTTIVELQQLASADGVAFGPDGALYVTVNRSNRVWRVDVGDGSLTDVARRSSGLSYPTQVLFPDADTMLVTNGALSGGVPDLIAVSVR